MAADKPPNFLFILSDDQSWQHTSYEGNPYVNTPAFDRIAAEGVYFRKAFVSAPSCTESRSAILSGQHFWQTGSGAMLWGEYSPTMPNFIHQLAAHGYETAYTGKGWGPGTVPPTVEPTGKLFKQFTTRTTPADGYVGLKGYAKSLEAFLDQRSPDKPFFFWAGVIEPHRDYLEESTNRFEDKPQTAWWPSFMPYAGRAQKQMSRYLEEIEYGDREVGKMLATIEKHGLLENTIIIYTSDNGMPFAGAKNNLYRYGVQVPLAIWWKNHHVPLKSREQKDRNELVSLIDVAPTVLTLAGLPVPKNVTGQSLSPLLQLSKLQLSKTNGVPWKKRDYVLTGFERHMPTARSDLSTYPVRGLITDEWFYLVNYRPERWPQGDPGGKTSVGYQDTFIAHLQTYKGKSIEPFFSDLLGKRPAQELYAWGDAPGAANNKAGKKEYLPIQQKLDQTLTSALATAGDPGIKNRDYFYQTFGKSHPSTLHED